MTRRRRKQVGVRLHKGKLQAYIEINGKQHHKSFALDTAASKIEAWKEQQRLRYSVDTPSRGSLAADITTYLSRVTAMPTYKQRAAHLELWAKALGRTRARASITTTEIDRVLQTWLTTPSRPPKGQRGRPSATTGIAPATVRKRRTALLSLFETLNDPDADDPNPVRASHNPANPKPESRGLDYETIGRILDAMPESLTKRRVVVLAYTGLPPALLEQVQAGDVDLDAATVRVQPRRKGAGVEARTLQLLPQGVAAFRALAAADGFGPFAVEAVNRSFQRACRRADVTGVTLYDLRHSFGALLYRKTRDLATVSRFLMHASLATTARYAQSAMVDVDQEAAARAGAAITGARTLSETPTRKRPARRRAIRRAS